MLKVTVKQKKSDAEQVPRFVGDLKKVEADVKPIIKQLASIRDRIKKANTQIKAEGKTDKALYALTSAYASDIDKAIELLEPVVLKELLNGFTA